MKSYHLSALLILMLSLLAFPQKNIAEHNPYSQFAKSQVYLPLEVGNAWQMISHEYTVSWPLDHKYRLYDIRITADSVFSNGKRYFLYGTDAFIRYDTLANIVYVARNDSEYVYINFSLPADSLYWRWTSSNVPDSEWVSVIEGNIGWMDTIFETKGYMMKDMSNPMYLNTRSYCFVPGIGLLEYYHESGFYLLGNEKYPDVNGFIYVQADNMIQACIKRGDSVYYYDDNSTPVIAHTSLTVSSIYDNRFSVTVTHKYSALTNPPYVLQGRSFIDTVYVQLYASDGTDTVRAYEGYLQRSDEITFYKDNIIADSLLQNGYNRFHFRITARDKGIIPDSATYPIEGFGTIIITNPYAAFYPLSPGNEWVYKKYSIAPDNGLIFDSYFRTVSVKDTLLSNGKTYNIMKDNENNITYERTDTISGNLYRAKIDKNLVLETMLDSLSAPLNSTFSADRFLPDTLVKVTQINEEYREVSSFHNPPDYYRYKSNLGIITFRKHSTAIAGSLGYHYELIAARINGIIWGNSALLDMAENKPENLDFSLLQNYPNPFNPTTVITWQLPVGGEVTLELFNIMGERVAKLVDDYQNAGRHSYYLTSEDYPLSSGVYIYRLHFGKHISTRKLMLLK